MKKVLALFAFAAVFAACNNESETSAADAAQKAADSTRVADSIKAVEAAAKAAADTTHKIVDSAAAKIDSVKK